MDDWLEDTQNFSNKKVEPKKENESKKEVNPTNCDINDVFNNIAKEYVEYKLPEKKIGEVKTEQKKELSVDKKLEVAKKEQNSKKNKKKNKQNNDKNNIAYSDEEEYYDEYQEYDEKYNRYNH
jgi:hypothetical protein